MFKNRVVLVTGASSGIGKAIALAFAAQEATVGLLARRADRLEAVAREVNAVGGQALPLPADLADDAALERSVHTLTGRYGRLDVLVNNAGTGIFGRQPTPAEFDRIMGVNVRAVWRLSHLCLPWLEQSGGSVINLGSAVVERPFANELVYMASKGAVTALTAGMAASWGKRGVRANLIQPGVVESEFLEAAGMPPAVAAAMHAASEGLNALAVTGQPADVAQAALFLASEGARFVTGATLNVDGGFTLGTVRG